MNLHQVVSSAIGAVNPNAPVIVQTSAGNSVNPDGSVVPTFNPPFSAIAQVQELTTRDLRQLDGLNIQGSSRAIYLNGEVDAIVRVSQRGGDLITLADGSVWLTTHVLEQWPDWVKVSVTLQNGS